MFSCFEIHFQPSASSQVSIVLIFAKMPPCTSTKSEAERFHHIAYTTDRLQIVCLICPTAFVDGHDIDWELTWIVHHYDAICVIAHEAQAGDRPWKRRTAASSKNLATTAKYLVHHFCISKPCVKTTPKAKFDKGVVPASCQLSNSN